MFDIIEFSESLTDLIRQNNQLRYENQRLYEIEKKYNDLLSKTVTDGNKMVCQILTTLLEKESLK